MGFLLSFVITVAVIWIAPQVLSGVRVRDNASAIAAGIVFAVASLLVGWLIKLALVGVFVGLTIVTLGLGALLFVVFGAIVNAILFKITDALMDSFHIDTWTTAFLLGGLLSIARWVVLAFVG